MNLETLFTSRLASLHSALVTDRMNQREQLWWALVSVLGREWDGLLEAGWDFVVVSSWDSKFAMYVCMQIHVKSCRK